MIEISNEKLNISKAILAFQSMVSGVHKGASNPHFKTKYANLETVVDAARPALQKVGVFFTQSAGNIVDGSMEMTTMLIHAESGEWLKYTMFIPLGKKDPQGAGSAQTYAQRYSLMAALGLPPTDDDAEVAIDREEMRPVPELPKPKSSAQLKRERSWETIVDELELDMVDVRTLVQFETLKQTYREKVAKEGWPAAWKYQLKDKLEGYENEIRDMQNNAAEDETVSDIQDQFPGAKVTNVREAAE